MSEANIYEELAILFRYPGADYRQHIEECRCAAESESSDAAARLREFSAALEGLSNEDLQELYTRTFDLNPLCTLEIGWQLYGEEYRRGEFLVEMREQLAGYGVAETGELPDHLTHALALLARLEADEAAAFASLYVLPALDKMRTAWTKHRNAFAGLLELTFDLLKSRYPYDPARTPARIPELHVLP